jgi:dTDP-glucose pyrophosphorylase
MSGAGEFGAESLGPEEHERNNGWIGPREVRSEAENMGKSNYAAYLLDLLAQKGG